MLPKTNQTLYVQITSDDEDQAQQEFKTRIEEVNAEQIVMEIPILEETGELLKMNVGDSYTMYYKTETSGENYFDTEVLNFKVDVLNFVTVKMPKPASITRIQRRNYLRVPAQLEIAVKLTEQIRFVAFTKDIGGGGISFVCESYIPLQTEDTITCWLLIHHKNGMLDHVPFKGELVRIIELEEDKIQVMLRYTDIEDTEREKIIRYTFERQLDLKRK